MIPRLISILTLASTRGSAALEERVKPFAELMSKHAQIINHDRLGKGLNGSIHLRKEGLSPVAK